MTIITYQLIMSHMVITMITLELREVKATTISLILGTTTTMISHTTANGTTTTVKIFTAAMMIMTTITEMMISSLSGTSLLSARTLTPGPWS